MNLSRCSQDSGSPLLTTFAIAKPQRDIAATNVELTRDDETSSELSLERISVSLNMSLCSLVYTIPLLIQLGFLLNQFLDPEDECSPVLITTTIITLLVALFGVSNYIWYRLNFKEIHHLAQKTKRQIERQEHEKPAKAIRIWKHIEFCHAKARIQQREFDVWMAATGNAEDLDGSNDRLYHILQLSDEIELWKQKLDAVQRGVVHGTSSSSPDTDVEKGDGEMIDEGGKVMNFMEIFNILGGR